MPLWEQDGAFPLLFVRFLPAEGRHTHGIKCPAVPDGLQNAFSPRISYFADLVLNKFFPSSLRILTFKNYEDEMLIFPRSHKR